MGRVYFGFAKCSYRLRVKKLGRIRVNLRKIKGFGKSKTRSDTHTMGPPFFKNLKNQKASALGGSVRREGVVKGVVGASRNGTRTIRPRDVSRTATLALSPCLALLALPPFLRLHPRCHQIDTFPPIDKPRSSSHPNPIARDMRIAQLVGRLASTHCPAQATAPYGSRRSQPLAGQAQFGTPLPL